MYLPGIGLPGIESFYTVTRPSNTADGNRRNLRTSLVFNSWRKSRSDFSDHYVVHPFLIATCRSSRNVTDNVNIVSGHRFYYAYPWRGDKSMVSCQCSSAVTPHFSRSVSVQCISSPNQPAFHIVLVISLTSCPASESSLASSHASMTSPKRSHVVPPLPVKQQMADYGNLPEDTEVLTKHVASTPNNISPTRLRNKV